MDSIQQPDPNAAPPSPSSVEFFAAFGLRRIGEPLTGNAMVADGATGLPANIMSVPVAIHVAASAGAHPTVIDPMTEIQERLAAAQQTEGITP